MPSWQGEPDEPLQCFTHQLCLSLSTFLLQRGNFELYVHCQGAREVLPSHSEPCFTGLQEQKPLWSGKEGEGHADVHSGWH